MASRLQKSHVIKTATVQAHGKITHVLTVNTTGQVDPSVTSTVGSLQTLQNATNSHKNLINAKTMAKTYQCQKNTNSTVRTLAPSC